MSQSGVIYVTVSCAGAAMLAGMSVSARHSLRLVVQHIQDRQRSCFRLVSYGDGPALRPVEFPSLEMLRKALASVFPELSEATLSIKNDARETYIVLTRDAELDDRELALLGLRR